MGVPLDVSAISSISLCSNLLLVSCWLSAVSQASTTHQDLLLIVLGICIGSAKDTRLANAHESIIVVTSNGEFGSRPPGPSQSPTEACAVVFAAVVLYAVSVSAASSVSCN